MLFVYCLPLFLLIIPASTQYIIYYFVAHLFLCAVIHHEYRNKKVGYDKRILSTSIIIDSLLVFSFINRWLPSSIVTGISNRFHLNNMVLLFFIGVVLGIVSLFGLYRLISLLVNYVVNINNVKLVKWLKSDSNNTKQKLILSVVLAFILWLSQTVLPIYTDIDNYGISLILNGEYSNSDNFCCFVNPILSILVKGVDSVLPNADGFVLLMELFMTLAFSIFAYLLLSACHKKINILISWLFIILINLSLNLFHANFTIYTSILCFIGLLGVYLFCKKKVNILVALVSVSLFFVGGLFRFESQLLILPFYFLACITEIVILRKEIRKHLARYIVVLLVLVICCGGNKIVYNFAHDSEIYQESVKYNSERSKLFDFKNSDWEDISSKLEDIGVSQNDYESLKESLLADTDIVTADYMREINKISNYNFAQKMSVLPDNFTTISFVIQTDTSLYLQIFAFIVLLLLLVLLTNCSAIYFFELILSIFGSLTIVTYFAFIGRVPDRVIQSIFLGNWFVLIVAVLSNKFIWKIQTGRLKILISGALISVIAFSYYNIDCVNSVLSCFNSKAGQPEDNVSTSNKYIWETNSYNKYIQDVYWMNNKLPSNSFMNKNTSDGKWVYGQVCYNEYLSRIGLVNPMKSLVEDNVYYVSDKERCDSVLTFLHEHYGADIIVREIDKIDNIPVWKFSKG